MTVPRERPTIEDINRFTDNQLEQLGYPLVVNHGTFFVGIEIMTFGKGRIFISSSLDFIDNAWCYKSFDEALAALSKWDVYKQIEPEGWFRNPCDGRRRPEGDKSKEYIRY